jgi:hypothetical protein
MGQTIAGLSRHGYWSVFSKDRALPIYVLECHAKVLARIKGATGSGNDRKYFKRKL